MAGVENGKNCSSKNGTLSVRFLVGTVLLVFEISKSDSTLDLKKVAKRGKY
jgi:hypothetical protein